VGSLPPGARGPKPGLTIEEITGAAIELADAAGLEHLSMRRVAERLGAGTMSLYRYAAGKAELLDLMVDCVCGAEAAAALSAAERGSVSQTDEEWWNEAGPALVAGRQSSSG
jgi:AcrR family transcriptional regulator